MYKITVQIDGMSCGMCESHVNEAIRRSFDVKKVSSSHSKGITEIICEEQLEQSALEKALDPTGYRVLSVSSEPYEKKKGLFGRSRNA